jgi:hypothetical protein
VSNNVEEMIDNMKCNCVRKIVLSHSDEELSERQTAAIQDHLNSCPDCLRQFETLSKFFNSAREFNRIQPSPFLWKKLSSRIDEYESSRNPFTNLLEILPKYATAFAVIVFISLGIYIGIFLGSAPDPQRPYNSRAYSTLAVEDQFVESLYLDIFDDLPPESLGGIFITLTSEKK